MQAVGIPALLVGGTSLGAISHALTAHAGLTAVGVPVAGVGLSQSEASPVPPAEIAATVTRYLPETAAPLVRRGAGAAEDLAHFAASLLGRQLEVG